VKVISHRNNSFANLLIVDQSIPTLTPIHRAASAASASAGLAASGRAIFWPQDVVRRCAMAMKESRSRDWFRLARIGLEAAVANDVELVALLDTTPVRRQAAEAELVLA
jgi:hypothetical protein